MARMPDHWELDISQPLDGENGTTLTSRPLAAREKPTLTISRGGTPMLVATHAEEITYRKGVGDLVEAANEVPNLRRQVGLAEGILRKLLTDEGDLGSHYFDVEDGIVDTRATFTHAEQAYLQSLAT